MSDSDPLRKQLSSLFGQFLSQSPALARAWGRGHSATIAASNPAQTPFVPLRTPLARCRLALITTGGVHRVDQPPYDMADSRGDPSYRVIAADTPREQLTITHDYYDHRDAERDLNILFPLEFFRELATAGQIGGLATCYSFMGHIEPPHVATLTQTTAPQVAEQLRQEQVDAVLLTPA